jgi:molybdopterin molybdotransferase
MLLPVPQARNLLSAINLAWPTETIAFNKACTRVRAQKIVADRDQPPFNRVAMDGIAINYAAYAAGQRRFPIAWLQAAGAEPKPLDDQAKCVEIMTGAALPAGVTTVIRYEDIAREGNDFLLPEGLLDGKSIHARGKDIVAGMDLVADRRRIGVAEMGMLATCGYDQVEVVKKPVISVVATGNELVPVDQTPVPHQIRMSNVFQLASLLETEGAATTIHHYPDDRDALLINLENRLSESDLVVLSGGVSKGKLDFVPGVLEELGVEKLFHGVAQRPGKPLWVGRRGNTVVFGLPGNPVSSVNCLVAYVLPFIRQQFGLSEEPVFARLAEDVSFKPNLTFFQLVSLQSDPETGALIARPTSNQGSGDATSMLRSDGFLELPQGREVYLKGEVFRVGRF